MGMSHSGENSVNILLAVNESSLPMSCRKLLENISCIIEELANPAEDLQFLKNPGKYDILLTDLRIGDISGLEVARKLKALNAMLKVIMISDLDIKIDESEEYSGKDLPKDTFPVDHFIQKPIRERELVDVVIKLITNIDKKKSILLKELESFGASIDSFKACTVTQLEEILTSFRTFLLHRSKERFDSFSISEADKKILNMFLVSNGRISSLFISKTLNIPLTTVQRRRKRLETHFLEMAYSLKIEKFGFRKAEILVSTDKGNTVAVGKELLTCNEVLGVSRAIGAHTVDLRAEVFFKTNSELLDLIERIKSIQGVQEVRWYEMVEIIGENAATPLKLLQSK